MKVPKIVHFKIRWGMGGWGIGTQVPNNVQEFLSAAANGNFRYIPPASGGKFYALMGPSRKVVARQDNSKIRKVVRLNFEIGKVVAG